MKKTIVGLLIAGLCTVGCSSAVVPKIVTKSELKYKKILILPFIEEDQNLNQLAYKEFLSQIKSFDQIEVVDNSVLTSDVLAQLNLNQNKYSVIDFSVGEMGAKRRAEIMEKFHAQAIILGSVLKIKNNLSTYIQAIDVQDGQLTLSFSKNIEINDQEESALKELITLSSQKVIDHIKDNLIMTTITKY